MTDPLRATMSFVLDDGLRFLLEAIPIPVFIKDTEGRYLSCNSAFYRFFGKTEEQTVGKTAFDITDPDLADLTRQKERQALERGAMVRYEHAFRDASNRLRIMSFSKAPLVDQKGVTNALLGTMVDITAAKKKSTAFLNEIIAAVALPMFIKDPQHRYLAVNPPFCRLTGLSAQEVVGRTDDDLFDPLYAQAFMASDQQVLLATTLLERSLTYTNHLGHEFVLEVRKISVALEGAGTLIIGIIDDLTERKRTHDLLNRSEQGYRMLFENGPMGVVVVDANGLCININQTMCRMMQVDRDSLVGVDLFNHPQLVKFGLVDDALACLNKRVTVTNQRRYRTTRGREMTISYIIGPLTDSTGRVMALQAMVMQGALEKARREPSPADLVDALTGLRNDRAFAAQLEQMSHPYTVLVLNSRFPGDDGSPRHQGRRTLVMRQTADILVRVLRSSDVLAHTGETVFSVLLATADAASLDAIIRRLRDAFDGAEPKLETALVNHRSAADDGVSPRERWQQALHDLETLMAPGGDPTDT